MAFSWIRLPNQTSYPHTAVISWIGQQHAAMPKCPNALRANTMFISLSLNRNAHATGLSFPVAERDAAGIFHFANHENTVQASVSVKVSEPPGHKILIMGHAAGIDFQLIIIVSRGVEAFHNFIYAGYD